MSIVDDKARQLLEKACAADNGRAAKMLVNDGPLRQTVIALKEGTDGSPVEITESVKVSSSASWVVTSPGTTRTDTPLPAMVDWMAWWRTTPPCSAELTISQ